MTKAYLEPAEVEALEEAATNLRDRLLIRLLSHLGCRISEALALAVEDIDLEQGRVTILHLKTRLNLACPHCNARLGRKHSFCPGCGQNIVEAVRKEQEHRRVRTLPLDEDTVKVLRDYISRGGPVLKKERLLIFGINRHRAWQVIRECAQRAGLPELANPDTGKVRGISPHRLRDSFAVHAVKVDDSGDGLRLLQEHLGHSSFNTTARYRKIGGDELKEWYGKLWSKKETPDG
ncbi:MAG: tyrosine-type recombinase/integrase [Dehalococcoidia bacterium]|nr:tyrosine-type recombinase/integrase [Dehalococcoidia bacterium]